ncbi:MAG TPA: hypothetical protein VF541_18090 [Longimicrobium sp.]
MTQPAFARSRWHAPHAGKTPRTRREKRAHRLVGDVRLPTSPAAVETRRSSGIGLENDGNEQRGRTGV